MAKHEGFPEMGAGYSGSACPTAYLAARRRGLDFAGLAP